jgi:hypothetical protein
MARLSTLFITAIIAAACTTPAHTAENLAARIAAAPDGTVAFTYPARAGVCGDGATFIAEIVGPNQQNFYTANGVSFGNHGSTNFGRDCVEGPMRIVLDVKNGVVTDMRPYAGKAGKAARTELGHVTTQEATDYLLDLGKRVDYANDAFMAASLGEGSRISVPLVKYAGDRGTGAEVRESAVKWIGRTAEREGTASQVLPTLRDVVQEKDASLQLRERALRAIGEFSRGDDEVRALYARLDQSALRERAMRILAEIGGAENEAFIKKTALDRTEDSAVRERAVRVLGDELGRLDIIREMYDQLDDVDLRSRAVRSVAEHLNSESAGWVRGIAENASEEQEIRDRAIRTLGEAGYTAQLRTMYASLRDSALKDRVIRVVNEYGSEDDRRWIESVATNDREESAVRERALRVLAEHGMSTTRLVGLYDGVKDTHLQDRVLRLLGERSDDDAAIEKLVSVARGNGDTDLRRRAVRILGESDHPRAREFVRTTVLQR